MSDRNSFAPVRLPHKTICEKCDVSFESVSDDTVCTQCMIKPSRRPTDFPSLSKGSSMSDFTKTVRKEKPCIDCSKKFTPTGNCQKRCPECTEKHAAASSTHPKRAQEHPFDKDVPGRLRGPGLAKTPAAQTIPSITVACTMQDTVAIFHALAQAGCTELVFGNTKFSIEAL